MRWSCSILESWIKTGKITWSIINRKWNEMMRWMNTFAKNNFEPLRIKYRFLHSWNKYQKWWCSIDYSNNTTLVNDIKWQLIIILPITHRLCLVKKPSKSASFVSHRTPFSSTYALRCAMWWYWKLFYRCQIIWWWLLRLKQQRTTTKQEEEFQKQKQQKRMITHTLHKKSFFLSIFFLFPLFAWKNRKSRETFSQFFSGISDFFRRKKKSCCFVRIFIVLRRKPEKNTKKRRCAPRTTQKKNIIFTTHTEKESKHTNNIKKHVARRAKKIYFILLNYLESQSQI